MPELPEVEVIRKELDALIRGETIKTTRVLFPGSVGYPKTDEFTRLIKDRTIEGLSRKGKFLIINLHGLLRLVIHLRMTGGLTYFEDNSAHILGKYVRIIFRMKRGNGFYFSDPRKFGRVWLLRPGDDHITGLDRLGPDWWTEVSEGEFKERLAGRCRSRIKGLLLDQKFLAGLGNIYADESLFRAGIHPLTRAGSLSDSEAGRLFGSVRETLLRAIKNGGTSISDYRNTSGEPGAFQNMLMVYQRKGERCHRCNHTIERMVVCGRGTYFCPSCQVRSD
ncbi:MAG: DNA-formamidopyrimidine glycosylase [Dethiobacteria bacterium]